MKIAVIRSAQSDFEKILGKYAQIMQFDPDEKINLSCFDACAILGGTEEEPISLSIDARLEVERFIKNKKPIFMEWSKSICYTYMDEGAKIQTVSQRMVYSGEETMHLHKGDLLDDHANVFYPFCGMTGKEEPILCLAGHVIAHDKTKLTDYSPAQYTLFKLNENVMICAFRFASYVRARFSPHSRWDEIASIIISFLLNKKVSVTTEPALSLNHPPLSSSECFQRGINWIEDAQLLLKNGEDGALEGFSHNILPDGKQFYSTAVRNDCSGELGGAYFFDWFNNKNEASLQRYKNLQKFSFEKLYVNEGIHKGMMRWSSTAWDVCYHDDVARTVLGTLLQMELTSDRQYLDKLCGALDYLVATTGTDGLRIKRTDAQYLSEDDIENLKKSPSDFPCAHHNGYYMAVLILAYNITGNKTYLDVAIKGIETIMSSYPDTIREHSETQELCRLILPLACLYNTTKEEKHRTYLYEVTNRLEKYRHKKGGYLEHDTGYKALRSRTSGTESSLLADNGDPVQDLLYSVNWLPLGFAYAFKATKDNLFLNLWRDIVSFLSEIQIESEDKSFNGAWMRGIDCDRREAYGMPHDVGWGPCAIESGWTVGEILMGIGYGIAIGMDK